MVSMKLALAGPVLLVMVTTAVVSTAAPVLYTTDALAIGPPLVDPPVFLVNQLNALSTMDGSATLADFDLDSIVDAEDFIVWNGSKFSNTGKWPLGDANGDGVTDAQDFIAWNRNKFQSADSVPTVPEPSAGVLLFAAMMPLGQFWGGAVSPIVTGRAIGATLQGSVHS